MKPYYFKGVLLLMGIMFFVNEKNIGIDSIFEFIIGFWAYKSLTHI